MRKIHFHTVVIATAGLFSALFASCTVASNAGTQPNIVLILLDDVGFADPSTFGGLVQTPSLERLAKVGLRYNRFHTVGICAPTRAALLSGRNHHRAGFGEFGGIEHPGYDGVWKKNAVSVAEVFRRNGYSTAAIGKWHNTPNHEITPLGPFDRWPTGLGFDYFYGNMMAMTSQWEPALWRNTVPVSQPSKPDQGYHLTADLVNEAIQWILTRESLAPTKPYFLYFAPGAAHTPHHVPQEWIRKYRGAFDQGWDVLREKVFARQKELGIIPDQTGLTARPDDIPAWESLSPDERKLLARQMEVYAAFLAHTDYEVGRLIQTVQSGARADNTLIAYVVGDNGPDPNGGRIGTDNVLADIGSVPTTLRDQLATMDELGGHRSKFNHYAQGWAWLGSTPFQWMKFAASHFGGTRNPLVISWPAGIKDRGALRAEFGHVVDIAPTLFEIAGITFPSKIDGVDQLPLDGVSLAYSFDQPNAPSRHRVQYFDVGGNRAIYEDGWVAAALHVRPAQYRFTMEGDGGFSDDRWELYNVAEDFSQAHDLATIYPAKLQELQRLFDQQARQNNVYPLGTRSTGKRISRQSVFTGPDYVYHAGLPSIALSSGLVPRFQDQHRVSADLTVSRNSSSGVVLAAGGRAGGFSFFLKDRRLVYESNYVGRERSVVESTELVPIGDMEVAYDFLPEGAGSPIAEVRLQINGRQVGSGRVKAGLSDLDNFDVGQDSASPVTDAYQAPFKFPGALRSVRVEMRR